MDIIELERWKPSEADSRKLEYAGQPLAQEVFEELKRRLEGTGYLPDEYFDLRMEWENGKEIPKDADIFCTVDYGGSEGVYVDVYLKWYDEKQKKSVTSSFIVGKTLGENGNDLDRMFLTASAITKAFHGDHATHARYMKIGGVEDDTGGRVLHLSQQEEKVIIEALVEQRERQEQAMGRTEQLLRRMTGSITAYMDTVGRRPLRLSGYDRAVLAIQDGELAAFKELYPRELKEHGPELFIEAAGRPGAVGRKMTLLLLADAGQFPETAYRAACERAIGINDPEKVSFLLEQAESRVPDLTSSFHGEMASFAYPEHRFLAWEIVRQCTAGQIAAAPPYLLEQAAMHKDFRALSTLVEKGLSGGPSAWRVMQMLTDSPGDQWMAEELLKKRMWVAPEDYNILHACVRNEAVGAGKLLLDGGMDFDAYQQWAEDRPCPGHEGALRELTEHWAGLRAEEAPTQENGGMTFG